MSNFNSALAFVMTKATNDELDQMIQALKMRRQQLVKTNIRSVKIGDKVEFSSSRLGTVSGTVTAVKTKFVHVNTKLGNYRVPANMLKIVESV